MTLDLQARSRVFGETVEEYINTVAGELPVDAVGLWQIIGAGRVSFGLDGGELDEFIRKCIFELLRHGAKPVFGGGGTEFDWIFQPQYGDNPEDIINSAMKELTYIGVKNCDPGGLWFAKPSSGIKVKI